MAVATTARGLLMLSLRLLLRLSPVTAVDTAMAATGVAAMDTTARGRLRLSPATATGATEAMAMVVTVVVMVATATARGLLSPATTAMAATAGATVAMAATAMAGATATGVSYHQIRRSELSQKKITKIVNVEAVKI